VNAHTLNRITVEYIRIKHPPNHLGKAGQSESPIKVKHRNQCVFISNPSISSQNTCADA